MPSSIKDAIEKLAGNAGVETAADPSALAAYGLDNPLIKNGPGPAAAIIPKDADQVARIIKLANEEGFKLVPFSSSGPHVKGGASCKEEHAALDLSSWKEIPWINKRNRVCLIQPGVTYGELLQALEPHGLTVSMPLAPRSGKSVLAAVMDREPSTWPNKQWDTADPAASTEFVFGTGDVFRTGAAAAAGSLEKQREAGGAQKSPMGPSQTDFHRVVQGSQGSMGVVTWITMRTEQKPSVQEPRVLGADKLEKLIPFIYRVQRSYLGEHSFVLDRNALAMLLTMDEPGTFGDRRNALPEYVCLQNLAGFNRMAHERVEYQLKDIGELADKNGLELAPALEGVGARELLEAATAPCGEKDWRRSLKGHCLSIFFLTTLDRVPEFIAKAGEAAKGSGLDPASLGTYVQPVVQNHSCHLEFMLPYDPGDSSEVGRAAGFEERAVKSLMEGGAFFSRPYGSAAASVFEANPLNLDLLRRIKAIFDPNRSLNPGKFGL